MLAGSQRNCTALASGGECGLDFLRQLLSTLAARECQQCRQKGRGVPAVWRGRAGEHRERDRVAVDQVVDQWDCSRREEPMLLGSSVG